MRQSRKIPEWERKTPHYKTVSGREVLVSLKAEMQRVCAKPYDKHSIAEAFEVYQEMQNASHSYRQLKMAVFRGVLPANKRLNYAEARQHCHAAYDDGGWGNVRAELTEKAWWNGAYRHLGLWEGS